jgi:hypothetical protein
LRASTIVAISVLVDLARQGSPRCRPQCIPVTRRRRFFFRKTGGVEETLGESLPLRQAFPTCEKPNKIGHFSSHRIRTVENRGVDPRSAQIAIIRPMAKVRILRNQASFLTAESLKPASAIRRNDGISDVACQCRPPAKAGRCSRNREAPEIEDLTVILVRGRAAQ